MRDIAGDWARYLSANAERSAMRKRNLSGMLLSATALLLMAVGIGFVVISKHQVGLSSMPVSTHSKFGLVTVSLLFASVLRGRVWTDRALILFVVLTLCSLSIEVSSMIAHAVIRLRDLCPRIHHRNSISSNESDDEDEASHELLLKNTPRLHRVSTIPFDPSFTPVQQL